MHWLGWGAHAAGMLHDVGQLADVFWAGATTTAHNIDPAILGKLANLISKLIGGHIVAAKGIWQPGVGVTRGEHLTELVHLLHIRAHLVWPQRAINAHADERSAMDRGPIRIHGLAAQGASALVGDGHTGHHWNPSCAIGKQLLNCVERRLLIERVKCGLGQQDIDAALQQCRGLVVIGLHDLIECHRSKAGIVHIWAEREGAVHRPQCAGHVARLARVALSEIIGGLTCDLGCPDVHLADQRRVGHIKIGHTDGLRIERVSLEDVRSRLEILAMNRLNHVGLHQIQGLVIVFKINMPVRKALAPISRLIRFIALDHGAHCPIQNQDALLE